MLEPGEIISVSQLNQLASDCLEREFPLVWVSGEISNLSCPASGHMYFSLKDDNAQVRCALFRFKKSALRTIPTDGAKVLVQAKVGIYPGRGDYQLIIQAMEPLGEGALKRKFDDLVKQLKAEGLFDAAHKKALPKKITSIGIVTSATGAAIADMLRVLDEYAPRINVVLYPAIVQGTTAGVSIAKQIETANNRCEVDLIIVGRGGGSLEDLWGFNEEIVARAIYASELPIISAVGHEVDTTISDFTADLRAPTPTAAARIVADIVQNEEQEFYNQVDMLFSLIDARIERAALDLDHLQARLKHPAQTIRANIGKLKLVTQRLTAAMNVTINKKVMRRQDLNNRLNREIMPFISNRKSNLYKLAGNLDALSPLKTLARGFCIAKDDAGIITSAKHKLHGAFELKFADGSWQCRQEKAKSVVKQTIIQ